MILIDKLLLSPIWGTIWIAKKIQQAIEEEEGDPREAITAQLSELYMMLETGRITQEEFDAKETELLDRLDALDAEADGSPPPS